MAMKCTRIINRTVPRYFTACDAARIARQVTLDRNVPPESVIACIAKGYGYTHILLRKGETALDIDIGSRSARRTLSEFVDLSKKVPAVIKIFPWVRAILRIAETIDVILDLIDVIQGDQGRPVDELIEPGTCNCKREGENNGEVDNSRPEEA